jgi:hypothetical protein
MFDSSRCSRFDSLMAAKSAAGREACREPNRERISRGWKNPISEWRSAYYSAMKGPVSVLQRALHLIHSV